MKQVIYGHVDCNNFFVSCERLFRPELEGKPVVVLSSNDGCAVSRSSEAKALGIPMGAPAFKYKDLFRQHHVTAFSANFELYGDISRRVTDVLTTITPNIEVYSVDESFLDLSALPISNYEVWGRAVRQAILQWVGVPVSIGIASSKTLAKAATHLAKTQPQHGGVYAFQDRPTREDLTKIAIGDVWGIGWRLAPRMRAEAIFTAADLAALRPQRAQQLMGVNGRQIVAELNGTSCHRLQLYDKPSQMISRTRTFGQDVYDHATLEAAIANFTTQAAFRLRRSRQLSRRAHLFLATNRHKPNYQYISTEVYFPVPTADTGELIQYMVNALGELLRDNHLNYYRAGVTLHDFIPADALQTDLWGALNPFKHDEAIARMAAIDTINEKFGKGRVHFAVQDLGNKWEPRQQLRSPRYVSKWTELPLIKPA